MTDDICGNRHKGNENSTAANATTNKGRDRTRILEYLDSVDDATCDETEVALGMNHQTCSARFSELKRDKKIEAVTKRKTRSGCAATAWKLSKDEA